MPLPGQTIPDARGHKRPVRRRGSTWLRTFTPHDPLSPAEFSALRTHLLAGRTRRLRVASWLGLAHALGVFAFTLMLLWNFLTITRFGPVPGSLQFLMLFFVASMASFGVWHLIHWRSRRELPPQTLADTLLSLGRCPSCLYKLADLPPDPDGATTCPECSAAWRLPTPADGT